MYIDGEKYACEKCVKDFCASRCQHHDRRLQYVAGVKDNDSSSKPRVYQQQQFNSQNDTRNTIPADRAIPTGAPKAHHFKFQSSVVDEQDKFEFGNPGDIFTEFLQSSRNDIFYCLEPGCTSQPFKTAALLRFHAGIHLRLVPKRDNLGSFNNRKKYKCIRCLLRFQTSPLLRAHVRKGICRLTPTDHLKASPYTATPPSQKVPVSNPNNWPSQQEIDNTRLWRGRKFADASDHEIGAYILANKQRGNQQGDRTMATAHDVEANLKPAQLDSIRSDVYEQSVLDPGPRIPYPMYECYRCRAVARKLEMSQWEQGADGKLLCGECVIGREKADRYSSHMSINFPNNSMCSAKAFIAMSSTISKDNTMGDEVRNANLLADFSRKLQHSPFRSLASSSTSVETD